MSSPTPRRSRRHRRTRRSSVALAALLGLVAALLVTVSPLAPAGAQQATEVLVIDAVTSPQQSGRIFRDALPATCEAGPKAYPGIFNEASSFGVTTTAYTAPRDGCLSISRTSADCGDATTDSTNAHLSLYEGTYDPGDQAAGFLGDQGSSTNGSVMSVNVEGGSTYVLVATNVTAVATCTIGVTFSLPPETTILTGADSGRSPATVAFTFTGSPDAATFECRLDDGAFEPCTSPVTYSDLLAGPHAVRVRATDAEGAVDPTPAVREWVVDLDPPNTQVTSPTSGTHVLVPRITATFTSADADLDGFLCQLDGGETVGCASPATFTGLRDGAHVLVVTAFDTATNNDPSPAVVGFSSCHLAPKTAAVTQAKKALKKAKRQLRKASTPRATKKAKRAVAKATKALKRAKRAEAACRNP
jgi:hypothetical protein